MQIKILQPGQRPDHRHRLDELGDGRHEHKLKVGIGGQRLVKVTWGRTGREHLGIELAGNQSGLGGSFPCRPLAHHILVGIRTSSSKCKIEAFIVDQVHLTVHQDHVMLTWMSSVIFKRKELKV